MTGLRAGLSKGGYDRQTYKMNKAKIAAGDDKAKEKSEKRSETNRQNHLTKKAKADAMDGKTSINSPFDEKKESTKKKGPSKSLESGRRSKVQDRSRRF